MGMGIDPGKHANDRVVGRYKRMSQAAQPLCRCVGCVGVFAVRALLRVGQSLASRNSAPRAAPPDARPKKLYPLIFANLHEIISARADLRPLGVLQDPHENPKIARSLLPNGFSFSLLPYYSLPSPFNSMSPFHS
jgi:hypothetical protein